jgi:hypothetical protein
MGEACAGLSWSAAFDAGRWDDKWDAAGGVARC